jgi:hypothetical protein
MSRTSMATRHTPLSPSLPRGERAIKLAWVDNAHAGFSMRFASTHVFTFGVTYKYVLRTMRRSLQRHVNHLPLEGGCMSVLEPTYITPPACVRPFAQLIRTTLGVTPNSRRNAKMKALAL